MNDQDRWQPPSQDDPQPWPDADGEMAPRDFGQVDTAGAVAAAAGADGPPDLVRMTANLWRGPHVALLEPGVGTPGRYQQYPATWWHYQKSVKSKRPNGDTREDVVDVWSLWATFQITHVASVTHFDPSEGWTKQWRITCDGLSGACELEVKPDDLTDLRSARKVFADAGQIAATAAKSARFGDALTQLRSYLDAPRWGAPVRTTDRIGRVDRAASDRPRFVFPGLTVGPDGPVHDIRYAATRPNAAAAHLRVAWDDHADIDTTLTRWVDAAKMADPSTGWFETATIVGHAAASAWATTAMRMPGIGGFPILYVDGAPGAGKSARVPRLLSPFGADPHHVSAGLGTVAQVRDRFTATRCVIWPIDELNLDYMSPSVAEKWRETLKDAYNARACLVGGAFGQGNFKLRELETSPALCLMGERLPELDPAIMDRLVSVSMRRRDNLSPQDRDRTDVGFRHLAEAADNPAMAAAAGAWFAWVLRNDLRPYLSGTMNTRLPATITNRNRPAAWCVLAGLAAFRHFLAEAAPSAADAFDELTHTYLHNGGLDQLTGRMTDLKGVGGAVAMLTSLAALAGVVPAKRGGPTWGSTYIIEDDPGGKVLRFSSSKVVIVLKAHEQTLDHKVLTDKAFGDELRSWRFASKARRRMGGSGNPVAVYTVPFDRLQELGGPSADDFPPPPATAAPIGRAGLPDGIDIF